MRKAKILLIVFVMMMVASVNAQIPELKISNPAEKPVQLIDLDAKVRVFGHMAETTMTMKFYNPNSRVLEGELEFPMPEGAVVSGYALDVDGELVEGVAVEKQKAREVFETEVRRGVDPGIVEKVKGNNFKTRVYPLNAKSSRIVQVTYITGLVIDDAEARYRVPLRLTKKTERFNLRVEVYSIDQKPSVKIEGLKSGEFSAMKTGWFSELAVNSADVDSEIVVTVPVTEAGAVFVEEASDGKFYFSIQGQAVSSVKNVATKPAKKIVILYDASGSGAKRDLALETKFIEALFASKKVADSVEVEFREFRNRAAASREFELKRGNVTELIAHIDSVSYDGGTSFAGTIQKADKPDFYLLFSDGILTYGKSAMPEFAAPVYAVSTADGADYSLLQNICRKSGGALLNLRTTELERAVSFIGAEFFGIVSRQADKALEEIYPAGRVAVTPEYMLAGILSGENANIALGFGDNAQTLFERSWQISRANAVKGDFLRKFWAGKKVDELMAEKDKNRGEIVALSKKHGIVNEFTSMIVLERVAQYIEHRIVPPASKAQWREEYFAAVEKADAEVAQGREEKLNSIIPQWEARLQWWNTDFSQAAVRDVKEKKNDSWLGNMLGSSAREESVRPASARFESEADMMAPQEMSKAMLDEVQDMPAVTSELAAPSPKAQANGDSARSVNPGVAIKAWEPDARYAKQIKESTDPYAEYLKQKAEYGNSPAFFLDCADVFIGLKNQDTAIQVLSNIAELELENPALLRILAHRLSQIEELETSAAIFEEVLEMRKEEPQSYRDLALVLGRMGEYKRAVELLYEIVLKNWDGRFPEIEVIALEELNSLIVRGSLAGVNDFKVDSRLVKPIDVDLRIVMTWDADQTDMDLWVIEPSGEKAYYSNPRTGQGGLVSRDFTGGYGPEEYLIRKARTGMYEVQTNFYGSRSQKIAGAVTLQVDIFTNFGRADEKRRSVTLRLTGNKETFKVADIEF
ncbi:MAG: DUF2135 domain-containing protein [Erysipelotrichia bacterium]|nr:DUF2135 domain-containing protein [Erysipelotrichia bacterium]